MPVGFKKKKKNQVMSPSPESRVPETGSDPPIGSSRDSGRDRDHFAVCMTTSCCVFEFLVAIVLVIFLPSYDQFYVATSW